MACLNWDSESNEIWINHCNVLRTPEKFKGVDAIYYMINLVKEFSLKEEIREADRVVVEFPAAYYNPKFSAGTMSPLSGVAGAAYAFLNNCDEDPSFNRAEFVYPAVWNRRKNKTNTRALVESLVGDNTNWEFDQVIKNPKMYEHVIDAVGMAYYVFERDFLNS